MEKLRVLDLFSGIGGFSLGLERTGGFETVAFCEIEEFPRRVLAKHWPEVRCYHDVRELTADQLAADGIAVDVITGGFPCQDISIAGRQAGISRDTRSGLWSEIIRLAGDLRPRFLIVENVANLLSGPSEKTRRVVWPNTRRLGRDSGYDAEWNSVSASALGACHHRDRIWLIAYPFEVGERRPADARVTAVAYQGLKRMVEGWEAGVLPRRLERTRARALRQTGAPRAIMGPKLPKR